MDGGRVQSGGQYLDVVSRGVAAIENARDARVLEGVERAEGDLRLTSVVHADDLRKRVPVRPLHAAPLAVLVAPNPVPQLDDAVLRERVLDPSLALVHITVNAHAEPPQSNDVLLLLSLDPMVP